MIHAFFFATQHCESQRSVIMAIIAVLRHASQTLDYKLLSTCSRQVRPTAQAVQLCDSIILREISQADDDRRAMFDKTCSS